MNLLETQNLFETRGKLTAIPEEFFNNIDGLKNMKGLTQNSEIFVDKCKTIDDNHRIHNWTHVVDTYVKDPTVSFVIIRSNKVSLMLVSNNPNITGTGRGNTFMASWSNVSLTIPGIKEQFYNNDETKYVGSEDALKRLISKTVNSYINYKLEKDKELRPDQPPRTKKNWDIVVVKEDPKHAEISTDRRKTMKGSEVKPPKGYKATDDIYSISDFKTREKLSNYKDYVNGLKDQLQIRLQKFKVDNMPEINTAGELKALLKSSKQLIPQRFKIAGLPYKYKDLEQKHDKGNLTLCISYMIDISAIKLLYGSTEFDLIRTEDRALYTSVDSCFFEIKTEGLKSSYDLKSFAFNYKPQSTYDYRPSNNKKFSEGIKVIRKLIEKLNQSKEHKEQKDKQE